MAIVNSPGVVMNPNAAVQTVQLGFGRVNLSSMNATFAPLRIRPPFIRDSAVTTARRNPGTQITQPVSNHAKVNGTMMTDHCTHPNGTIILLEAQWRRGSSPVRDAAIILRLREEAASINVIAYLPTGPDNFIGDRFSVFRGRADILSVDEAKVLRVEMGAGYVNRFFDADDIDRCFDVYQIQPETRPRPEVALVHTATGLQVRETPVEPTRRMRVRRNRDI